ncbi:MAG: hypothetical protein WCP21_17240 [Armatimonadota bacterium]
MVTFRFCSWISVGLLLLCVGCAPAYHSYQCDCSCLPYGYCPPAPLPYTTYCGCPTPVASSYSDLAVPGEAARSVGTAQQESGPTTQGR